MQEIIPTKSDLNLVDKAKGQTKRGTVTFRPAQPTQPQEPRPPLATAGLGLAWPHFKTKAFHEYAYRLIQPVIPDNMVL